MDPYTANIGLYVMISIHLIGFCIYLPTLKFVFKKAVPFKMVVYYIIAFMIALLIFLTVVSVWIPSYTYYPIETMGATLGELVGLGIGFLIFDGIIWFIAKKLYEVTHKSNHKEKEELKCWACSKKISSVETYHEFKEDGAIICHSCFEIYEKDEDSIVSKIDKESKRRKEESISIKPTEENTKKMDKKWKIILIILSITACAVIILLAGRLLGVL